MVPAMIYESIVVNTVCEYLSENGWTIRSSCGPTEQGDDIVAIRGGEELRVEVKGEGSEQPTSSRHGKPFTRNQVKSHVAVVFYRAAKMRTDAVVGGLAFPDNEQHREMVAGIGKAIRDLGLIIFWVAADGSVMESD